jgi:hypothetical protein
MLLRIKSDRDRAVAAFAVTVVIALVMRWEAGDLMWGIWAAATTYGWVYGVALIRKNPQQMDAGDGSDKGRLFLILTFFTVMFGTFHYVQGMFVNMLFPITSLEGWGIFTYPLNAFGWYWGVIATTFYARWPELMGAIRPSEAPERIFRLFEKVAWMQALIFLLMFLTSFGLIRFAAYPVLFFYFFPSAILREKAKYLLGKWEEYMDPLQRGESEEMDWFEEEDVSGETRDH